MLSIKRVKGTLPLLSSGSCEIAYPIPELLLSANGMLPGSEQFQHLNDIQPCMHMSMTHSVNLHPKRHSPKRVMMANLHTE